MKTEILVAVIGGAVGVLSAVLATWTSWRTKKVDERLTLKTKQLDRDLTFKAKELDEAFALKAKGLDEAFALKTKQMDHELEKLKLWVASYEAKMLEQRLKDYRELWTLTEATSGRRIGSLTSESASALAEQLTTWYYHEGGIVLSEEARDKYFDARSTLEPPAKQADLSRWHAAVVDAFSRLRTALCEDLNSRRGPRLRGPEERNLDRDAKIEAKAE